MHLTGRADFYGPSYGGHKPVQARLSPPAFDRSVYLPAGAARADVATLVNDLAAAVIAS